MSPQKLTTCNKEEYRSLEREKDEDESCTISLQDTDYTCKNSSQGHHTSVDLKSLRRAMTNLLETKASAFDSLINALQTLTLDISVDLRMLTQRNKIEEIITVFVIIFEIVIIGKSEFDTVLPMILKAASYLPIWAQARLARIWSHHSSRDRLRKLLQTLQQLISLEVIAGTYDDTTFIQDNEQIINATKLMKVLSILNNYIFHDRSIYRHQSFRLVGINMIEYELFIIINFLLRVKTFLYRSFTMQIS